MDFRTYDKIMLPYKLYILLGKYVCVCVCESVLSSFNFIKYFSQSIFSVFCYS